MRLRASMSSTLLVATALGGTAFLPAAGPAPAAHAAATSYYVDAVAGSDANAGTIAAPFKTLAKVSAVSVDVGDKIFLHRGQTHTGRLVVAAGVTVSAYSSGGMPTVTGGNGGPCVDVSGDGAVVMNIRASACGTYGFLLRGADQQLLKVTSRDNPSPGVRLAPTATNALVDDGYFAANTIGITAVGATATIRDAEFADNTQAVNVTGTNTTVTGNTIIGGDAGVVVNNTQQVVIDHNNATGTKSFVRLSTTDAADATTGVKIFYNRHWSTAPVARFATLHGATGTNPGPVTGVRVSNNSALLSGTDAKAITCVAGCTSSVLNELRGNVFKSSATVFTTDGVTGVDNVYWGAEPVKTGTSSYPYGPGETFAQPQFADAGTGDLHVASSSPAVDRVTAPSYSTAKNDLDGTATWTGSAALVDGDGNGTPRLDAGAYEAPAATPPSLKPGLSGLVVTQPTQQLGDMPYATFATIKVDWNAIEKVDDNFDFTAITNVLNAYNGQGTNRYIQFRVRIMAGVDSPSWVLGAGVQGTSPDPVKWPEISCSHGIEVYPDSKNGKSGCVPRFWTAAAQSEYLELMTAFAAQFETNPQVVDVVNSGCSTLFAETFILGVEDIEGATPGTKVTSTDRLAAGPDGYTRSKHQSCIENTTAALADSFPTTRISMSGHSAWQYIWDDAGDPRLKYGEWEIERDLWDDLIAAHGDQLTIEDHGLKADSTSCPNPTQTQSRNSWYCYMAYLPKTQNHGWQFTKSDDIPDWMMLAAPKGVEMRACYLEFASFDQLADDRDDVHAALVDNCD